MTIYYGDCLDVMADMPDDSVDLIVTSPPYADARKSSYGGVTPDEYVDWFLPRAEQIKRIMKPTGSFVLNIKEQAKNGERLLYVLDLMLAMKREVGFRWVDEFIWRKTSAFPGLYPNRLRNGWERLLHYSKEKSIKMCQERILIPSAISTNQGLNYTRSTAKPSASKSGLVNTKPRAYPKELSYPDNVLTLAPIANNTGHPATFPEGLPAFFINLFTDENDTVLDPFLGSGTTYKVAQKMNRIAIGIEILEEYTHLHQPDPQMMLL